MGGVGSGGRRVGAGRKPKSAEERRLSGNAGHQKVVPHPSVPPSSVTTVNLHAPPSVVLDEADAPNDLTLDERQIWMRLAPRAIEKRTLHAGTADYFKMFCRVVALEEKYAKSAMDAGSANHRGLIQRAAAMYKDFDIAPFGKPTVSGGTAADAPTVDPLKEKFFAGRRS